ncbi:Auxin-induced protein 5NG4 [Morus notabilis]|uniref:WAT1-related protein n=1 Tax=Morus notabilis TaxID=981085 RepID=W9S3Y4_9ROSA|nr:Auxin-induced protein 5NG4 [Morus notabilis]
MSCSSEWKLVATMLAVNFAFAIVNLLLKKTLDQGLNYLIIVTYRQAISAIFLTPIACFWERKSGTEITSRLLCYLFFSALVGVTLTQFLFLLGLENTSATFSCAFLNMVPVFTFILALPLGLEKLNLESKSGRAKILGTLICILGALILTFYRGTQLTHPHSQAVGNIVNANSPQKPKNWALGAVLLTAGCLMWSSWFLMQARIGKSFPFQYSSTAIISFFGAIQSAILSLILERNLSMWILKGKLEIISVVYAGMVGSALCYVGMSWCVKHKGPVFTSAFTPFTQIFVAIFDFSIFHEQVYLGSLLGSALVIIGMYTLLWGKNKEAKECLVKQSQTTEEGEDCNSQVIRVTIESRGS